MTPQEVRIYGDPAALADAVAARLLAAIAACQSVKGSAAVCLTGGGIGIAALRSVSQSPLRTHVDWGAVHLWWGDERFLPSNHPDRNETQARLALIDGLPVRPERVHAMPSSDRAASLEAAVSSYSRELLASADGDQPGAGPSFDVVLLGIGEDAHVASLFPGAPAVAETRAGVAAVRDAPKPPPVRVTLTLPTICAAREVWLLACGEGKAEAVAQTLTSDDPSRAPASAARGRERTLLLIDEDAAALVDRG